MSYGPCGQEMQLAWNQELGNQKLGCVYFLSGAARVSCHLPPQTSFLPQHAHKGETGHPNPILHTPQFECPASINKLLSTLITDSLNGSRLAQIGQMPSLVCAVRSQGWEVGWALIRTGRSQKDQSLPNVSCLLALWQERTPSLFFP